MFDKYIMDCPFLYEKRKKIEGIRTTLSELGTRWFRHYQSDPKSSGGQKKPLPWLGGIATAI